MHVTLYRTKGKVRHSFQTRTPSRLYLVINEKPRRRLPRVKIHSASNSRFPIRLSAGVPAAEGDAAAPSECDRGSVYELSIQRRSRPFEGPTERGVLCRSEPPPAPRPPWTSDTPSGGSSGSNPPRCSGSKRTAFRKPTSVLTRGFVLILIRDAHFVKPRFHHGCVGAQLVVEPWLGHGRLQVIVEEQHLQDHLQEKRFRP